MNDTSINMMATVLMGTSLMMVRMCQSIFGGNDKRFFDATKSQMLVATLKKIKANYLSAQPKDCKDHTLPGNKKARGGSFLDFALFCQALIPSECKVKNLTLFFLEVG